MGFGLTTTITRSLVKHGGMPHAPIPILNSLPVPCDEPPPKRRRVSTGLQRKRGVKECLLSQVTPLVERAVGHLSRDVYHVNALAIKVTKKAIYGKALWLTMGLDGDGAQHQQVLQAKMGRDRWLLESAGPRRACDPGA